MWIRSAFWVGRPKDDDVFREAIDSEVVPRLRTLPGVTAAQALWPKRLEDGPPAIHCQVLVHFASLADVDRMLASDQRAAMRARVREIARDFDGELSHIDYEVG